MMHRESCVCGMDSLELFQIPATNVALEESKWVEYYPVSSTLQSDTAPIEFDIKGQGDEYLDLSQTYLQLCCKFTKSDVEFSRSQQFMLYNFILTPVDLF